MTRDASLPAAASGVAACGHRGRAQMSDSSRNVRIASAGHDQPAVRSADVAVARDDSVPRRAPYVMMALALIGFAVAFYDSYAIYNGQSLWCPPPINGCNEVAASPYARIFDLPVGYYGVVYYLYMFALAGLLAYDPLARGLRIGAVLYAALGYLLLHFGSDDRPSDRDCGLAFEGIAIIRRGCANRPQARSASHFILCGHAAPSGACSGAAAHGSSIAAVVWTWAMVDVGRWRRLAVLVDLPADDAVHDRRFCRHLLHRSAVIRRWYACRRPALAERKPLGAADSERTLRERRNCQGGIRGKEDCDSLGWLKCCGVEHPQEIFTLSDGRLTRPRMVHNQARNISD